MCVCVWLIDCNGVASKMTAVATVSANVKMAVSAQKSCSVRRTRKVALAPAGSSGSATASNRRGMCSASASSSSSSAEESPVVRQRGGWLAGRRAALHTGLAATILSPKLAYPNEALAVKGLTAGRVPGLSATPDANGFFHYERPEGKSGGHGVGWSEFPSYFFDVPEGWREVPVSIADLGGTEVDLRFESEELSNGGEMSVIVAPVLRFQDIGFNADVRIDQLGSPQKMLEGFAPELVGGPVEPRDIVSMDVVQKDGLTYYTYEVSQPRKALVSITACLNRVYLCRVSSTSRVFKRAKDDLISIRDSFGVNVDQLKSYEQDIA